VALLIHLKCCNFRPTGPFGITLRAGCAVDGAVGLVLHCHWPSRTIYGTSRTSVTNIERPGWVKRPSREPGRARERPESPEPRVRRQSPGEPGRARRAEPGGIYLYLKKWYKKLFIETTAFHKAGRRAHAAVPQSTAVWPSCNVRSTPVGVASVPPPVRGRRRSPRPRQPTRRPVIPPRRVGGHTPACRGGLRKRVPDTDFPCRTT
jgi:hypothetical protein